jgi:hypothetical protein
MFEKLDAFMKRNVTDKLNKPYVPKEKKPLGTSNKLDAWLKLNITDKFKKPIGKEEPKPKEPDPKVSNSDNPFPQP